METIQRKLTVDSLAWAKMQWFMQRAKKLEISGFGITEEENPLRIIDFQTIPQENTGGTTDLNDMALAKYVSENAKRGINPSCCMRIWIHSHPFCLGEPTPSQTDTSTLHKKLLDGTDWAVMMILGKGGGYFAELHSTLKMAGRARPVVIPLYVDIDWMSTVWEKNEERWEKEYKRNIKKSKPVVIQTVSTGLRNPQLNYYEEDYDAGGTFDTKGWLNRRTGLSTDEYTQALNEGFTFEEITKWKKAVINFTPSVLRVAEQKVLAENKRRREQSRRNHNKKNKKGKKASKRGIITKIGFN